ncbi:MAG: hypothetical protein WA667_11495 [Candidatus Nitrosopolaris sp.]
MVRQAGAFIAGITHCIIHEQEEPRIEKAPDTSYLRDMITFARKNIISGEVEI